ncbi:Putative uncharacterized protein [Moritella viscosa]|uniref:Uncharacterized protein n=1 Tax=Moritella viscosa TaxID=80854 RepID=A0ABY1HKI5_9GAMM|nr:Putative uncharacterized protein [Moritella viscosa]
MGKWRAQKRYRDYFFHGSNNLKMNGIELIKSIVNSTI